MKRFTLIAITCIIILAQASIAQPPYPTVEIHHIDVGQGDGALINIKNNTGNITYSILIDAGETDTDKDMIQYLKDNAKKVSGEPYIDYIIASHYHDDHIGGLIGHQVSAKRNHRGGVCRPAYQTGVLGDSSGIKYFAVLDKGYSDPIPNTGTYTTYTRLAGSRRVTVGSTVLGGGGATVSSITAPPGVIPAPSPNTSQQLSLGGYINLGTDANGVAISLRLILADAKVYNPSIPSNMYNVADTVGKQMGGVNLRSRNGVRNNPNNWGLGWVLEYGAFRYYTAGDIGGHSADYSNCTGCSNTYFDIETPISEALENIYPNPTDAPGHICVQKISHHGSCCSSKQAFLRILKSSLAVISCGYNNHGHPSQEVISRLEDLRWAHTVSLLSDSLERYIMTELYVSNRNINLKRGFTSGSTRLVAIDDVPTTDLVGLKETHTMLNGGKLYEYDSTSPITGEYGVPGNVIIKVYPDNGGSPAILISRQSGFIAEYNSYKLRISPLSLPPIQCHTQ